MNADEPVVLYIILRQSLQLNGDKTAYCAANAMQYLLMKYFTLQVVAVKTNLTSLINDDHLKTTTKWLSSNSRKSIVSVDEEIWGSLKRDFSVGKDIFCLKDPDGEDAETTLVFWPSKKSCMPSYIRELDKGT